MSGGEGKGMASMIALFEQEGGARQVGVRRGHSVGGKRSVAIIGGWGWIGGQTSLTKLIEADMYWGEGAGSWRG